MSAERGAAAIDGEWILKPPQVPHVRCGRQQTEMQEGLADAQCAGLEDTLEVAVVISG